MQPTQSVERKPPPPVEVSMNYLSWSVKDLVKVQSAMQETQSRQIAHISETLDKILIALAKAPF